MAKIKDTDYLAISARIRAMETTLLTAERMERLLEARSGEEVSKLLQECGYPELDAARPEAMDAALSQAREALLADLGDSAPDPQIYRHFQAEIRLSQRKDHPEGSRHGDRPGADVDGHGPRQRVGAENRYGQRGTGRPARNAAGGRCGSKIRAGYHP